MLVNAVSSLSLKDWKIVFVGPVEDRFKTWIDEMTILNPNLKSILVFTGEVSDRQELFEWYSKAKVLCLTSLYGSFEIVLVESLVHGDYIISTDVGAARDIIISPEIGKIVHDSKELKEAIQKVIDDDTILKNTIEKTMLHSKKFEWKGIISVLDKTIKGIEGK
jgi:glycosyltransferase involved in cell wall biosynthesis